MAQKEGILTDAYVSRFGKAKSEQEIKGYWIFASGLVLGLLGLFALAFSTMVEPQSSAAFDRRQIAAVLGGIGLPLVMLGIVFRLPIKRTADRVALVGTAVCLAAIAAFVLYYPGNWNVASGSGAADHAMWVTGVYGIGLLITGVAALVIPSMIDRRSELDKREDEVFRRESDASGREEAVDKRENKVSGRESNASAREDAVDRREDKVTGRESDASGREEAVDRREDDVTGREDSVGTHETAVTDTRESKESKAKFLMYKDEADKWRWNLQHRNGNIIADSGEGYSSKQKARQGLDSVRKNTPGAPIIENDDASNGDISASDSHEEEEEEDAEHEMYEDSANE